MSNLIVNGGRKLSGTITPAGNKNSALPILCATLLTDEDVIIRNMPELVDVGKLVESLKELGSEIDWDKEKCIFKINNRKITKEKVTGDLPVGMRGSILLFAPLLNRLKQLHLKAEIGGCALGIRELDPHLDVLRTLGTKVVTKGEDIKLDVKSRFIGGKIWPDYMSVTTTENFIMGAVLAKGLSVINNAASEPHVQDLCNCLISMGAKINGVGSSTLTIMGVNKLRGTDFTLSSDHHETTTLLALGAMTGGEIKVSNAIPQHFELINNQFKKLGVKISYEGDTAIVHENQKLEIEKPYTKNLLPKIEAAPWPYFPVDLLPLMVALAVKADGEIMFWNKVYESGLSWIPEMIKFGAEIIMADPHRIIVFGNRPLTPAVVDSPNIIRVAVALMMVALTIEGESIIKNADSIKRAHPHFIENLQKLGANIKWSE